MKTVKVYWFLLSMNFFIFCLFWNELSVELLHFNLLELCVRAAHISIMPLLIMSLAIIGLTFITCALVTDVMLVPLIRSFQAIYAGSILKDGFFGKEIRERYYIIEKNQFKEFSVYSLQSGPNTDARQLLSVIPLSISFGIEGNLLDIKKKSRKAPILGLFFFIIALLCFLSLLSFVAKHENLNLDIFHRFFSFHSLFMVSLIYWIITIAFTRIFITTKKPEKRNDYFDYTLIERQKEELLTRKAVRAVVTGIAETDGAENHRRRSSKETHYWVMCEISEGLTHPVGVAFKVYPNRSDRSLDELYRKGDTINGHWSDGIYFRPTI